jgi:alpha-glucoside transport system permease protein
VRRDRIVSNILVNGVLALICLVWTIPTAGLLISSFRTRNDIQNSGWWTIFPHREWVKVDEVEPGPDLDRQGVMEFYGVSGTFEELREGVEEGGTRVQWIGNRRLGRVEVQEQRWSMNLDFTLDNYQNVLTGKRYEVVQSDGSVVEVQGDDLGNSFINSLIVSIPFHRDPDPDCGLCRLWLCLDALPWPQVSLYHRRGALGRASPDCAGADSA